MPSLQSYLPYQLRSGSRKLHCSQLLYTGPEITAMMPSSSFAIGPRLYRPTQSFHTQEANSACNPSVVAFAAVIRMPNPAVRVLGVLLMPKQPGLTAKQKQQMLRKRAFERVIESCTFGRVVRRFPVGTRRDDPVDGLLSTNIESYPHPIQSILIVSFQSCKIKWNTTPPARTVPFRHPCERSRRRELGLILEFPSTVFNFQ